MSAPSRFEEARLLLASYEEELDAQSRQTSALYVANRWRGEHSQFLPTRTWIVANFDSNSAKKVALYRAHADAVVRLSHSVAFDWRQNYHAFWRRMLASPPLFVSSNARDKVGLTEYDHIEQLAASRGPRFLLDFSYIDEQLTVLRSFFFVPPSNVLGRDHDDQLAALLAATTSSSASVVTATLPRVEIGIKLSSKGLVMSGNFRALAALFDEVAESNEQVVANNISGAVLYEITSLWLPTDKELQPVEIDILIDMIASETSTIRHLYIPNPSTMFTADKRLEVFRQLLRTTVCSLKCSEPTLQSLHIEQCPINHAPMIAICSALRYTNSLKQLSLCWRDNAFQYVRANTHALWAWIAYGIFHPDSACRLDRFSLSGLPFVDDDHLHVFADMINSPHPCRQLYILEHGSLPHGNGLEEIALPATHRVFVQLRAKTKVHAQPSTRGRAFDLGPLESDDFEVAIQCTVWICVVVPGYGFGWSPNSAVTSRREEPTKCLDPSDLSRVQFARFSGRWPRAGANVKQFVHTKAHVPDSIEHIKTLLYMIGHALDGLDCPCHDVRISASDLTAILDACPNLTRLNLRHNQLASIEPIVERYESHECRIAMLYVDCGAVASVHLAQVAKLLASPASAPLRYLAASGATDDVDTWQSLEQALTRNHSLHLLYLPAADASVHSDLTRMQAAFEGSPLTSRIRTAFARSTFTPRMRAAFLSVVQNRTTAVPNATVVPSSVTKFDSGIIAQVFAFAGVRVPRMLCW